MLIACHLFFGICAGCLLQERYKNQYLVLLCLVGAVLPDIIDKPLGYLIFPEIGDGRLIAHALAGLLIIGITGWCLMKDHLLTGALLLGVMIHQILDEMWKIPVNWFYPLLGEFPVYPQEDYFGWGLMRELTTPSEWAFALCLLFLAWRWYSGPDYLRARDAVLSGIPALLLLIAGR